MSTIDPTNTPTSNNRTYVVSWLGLGLGDDGEPVEHAQYSDKSVQVVGTFDGATLAFEGSNNGTDWSVLTDPQGNALNITSAKIELVAEATRYVRPRIVGGTAPSLNVHLFLKE
jgi:hypothetical protein